MPTMADLFTAACDEYNWKWKTSVTPMLLLRWVTMDWGGISENDLVALLITAAWKVAPARRTTMTPSS
jgi:hypothetical protein